MRGATYTVIGVESYKKVSIHAPHAGRDSRIADLEKLVNVSIHAPHAGRDYILICYVL